MENAEPKTNALYAHIENLLKKIPELVTDEKELRYNKIKEMAENGDATLLSSLMKDEKIKAAFFMLVLDSFVFKARAFKEFLDYSSSNNSYSQYLGKKIGLYVGDSALTDRSEVMLNFPYKDCVLEGGQKKEDGLDTYFSYDAKAGDYLEKTDKRREVFFNETLAKDEIDSLFSPKAFCNVKKFTKDGEEEFFHLERDAEKNRNRGLADDTITDNLIIKGNNLLALHSLKKQFEGKVKLIYIDVPFNTGSDEFKYNDNFNHSSWLTFMKNRLEVARELLNINGVLVIHLGNEECSYVQVLLDSIFGRDCYQNHITMTTNAPSGFKATSGKIFSTANHIYIYSKKTEYIELNKMFVKKNVDRAYNKILLNPNDKYVDWKFKNFYDDFAIENGYKNFKEMNSALDEADINSKLFKYMDKNKNIIFRTAAISGGALQKRIDTVKISKQNKNIVYTHPNDDISDFYILNGEMIVFWKNTYREINGKLIPAMALTDVWSDIGFTGIANEGGVTLKNGKKPEKLIERVISLVTSPSDIVLDYHLGSGTTAAVAHKMNRQYIGVEQLDYGENDSVVRLKNVINGDTTGISKAVNWQGGGSFVYMELAEKNEKAMKIISACKSYDELIFVFENLAAKYFLHYNVRVDEFINTVCKENEFKNLPLKKQKEIFMRMLDLNQLYVNCDDRHDKDSGLSEDDIKATEDFYQLSKDGQ